jgi:diacylglycerol kinase family enzyme
MKILLVLNPVSGGEEKTGFLEEATAYCKKYGFRLKVFETTGNDDLEKLRVTFGEFEPQRVIAAGGDGTILLAGIILKNTGTPFGIVPLGSANGMATELNVNPEPMQAFKDALTSQLIAGLDMLMINEKHYAIHIGDVGINARIVEAYSKDENRGMATYAKYFIAELREMEPVKFTLNYENENIKEEGLMIGICNARKYGTGIPLNIEGNPMDGKFEIVIIKNIDANMLIRAGLSKFDERFHDSQNSTVISTEKAELTFDEPRLLQLDGEVIGKFEKLEIKILKHALTLITHRDNPYVK